MMRAFNRTVINNPAAKLTGLKQLGLGTDAIGWREGQNGSVSVCRDYPKSIPVDSHKHFALEADYVTREMMEENIPKS